MNVLKESNQLLLNNVNTVSCIYKLLVKGKPQRFHLEANSHFLIYISADYRKRSRELYIYIGCIFTMLQRVSKRSNQYFESYKNY